jgi:hypothetical protein
MMGWSQFPLKTRIADRPEKRSSNGKKRERDIHWRHAGAFDNLLPRVFDRFAITLGRHSFSL